MNNFVTVLLFVSLLSVAAPSHADGPANRATPRDLHAAYELAVAPFGSSLSEQLKRLHERLDRIDADDRAEIEQEIETLLSEPRLGAQEDWTLVRMPQGGYRTARAAVIEVAQEFSRRTQSPNFEAKGRGGLSALENPSRLVNGVPDSQYSQALLSAITPYLTGSQALEVGMRAVEAVVEYATLEEPFLRSDLELAADFLEDLEVLLPSAGPILQQKYDGMRARLEALIGKNEGTAGNAAGKKLIEQVIASFAEAQKALDPSAQTETSPECSTPHLGTGRRPALGPRSRARVFAGLAPHLKDLELAIQRGNTGEIRRLVTLLGAGAVPVLETALQDSSSFVRRRAVDSLVRMGPSAIPALERALRDPQVCVRHDVAEELDKVGPAAVPLLEKALGDLNWLVRCQAADGLGEIGYEHVYPVPSSIIPFLEKALGASNASERCSAAYALGGMGSTAARSVPLLIEALKDSDVNTRRSAALALGRIGPAALSAVPALANALGDPNQVVSDSAARALEDIGPAAVSELEVILRYSGARVRRNVVSFLGELGPEVIPVLEKSLKDPDEIVRYRAISGLERIRGRQ